MLKLLVGSLHNEVGNFHGDLIDRLQQSLQVCSHNYNYNHPDL
jgi:hypothetical protein